MLIVSFIFLTTYISVYEQMGHNAGVADTVAARTRNIRQRFCWADMLAKPACGWVRAWRIISLMFGTKV